ncbi:hypothetical protein Dimus_005565, partial [Dionaea muscipula]
MAIDGLEGDVKSLVSVGCLVVGGGVRKEGAEGDGVQEAVVLTRATVSSPCLSIPDFCTGASSVRCKEVVREGPEVVDGSVVVAQSWDDPFFSGGEGSVEGIGGGLLNGVLQTSVISKSGAVSHLSKLSDDVGLRGGGLVSEECRVLPVARGALRPQPTDGLRLPLSSPMDPVSVMAGGVGQDGRSGGRSYAHVVQVDRRADVELSYLPPVGGGNTITMEESDGNKIQWGSCLVGHFLQCTLPFGFVRLSVTRLWSKLGLTEVKSSADGFFVFRFGDSMSRDGVFEGRPWFVW